MNKKLTDAIILAVEETFGMMFPGSLSIAEPVVTNEKQPFTEVTVIMGISGGILGSILLKCSNKSAAFLASQMLNMHIEPGSEMMKDAIGEIVNIIVGTAKRCVPGEDEPFLISIPAVVVGERYEIYTKNTITLTKIPFEYETHAFVIEHVLPQ